MKSFKMEQESILNLIEELKVLKSITIMPKVSAFDEYMLKIDSVLFKIDSDLFKSKILKENSQGNQIHHELALLHKNLKDVKLIYQGSRDGYDPTKMTNKAKDYSFTFSVIQSNHGKIFGAYTPI